MLKAASPPILYGDHVVGKGEALFDAICKEGGEGIISKKAKAPYRGERGRNWLKVKCIQRQEFVIVGWQESDKRHGFSRCTWPSARAASCSYVGKVGTGFDTKMIQSLSATMRPLEVDEPPLEVPRAARRGSHWIEPKLVGEVAFTEFTSDGILRHPSFIALREDKPASARWCWKRPRHLQPRREERATRPTPESFGVKISNRDRVIYPRRRPDQGRPRRLLCGGRRR